MDSKALAKIQAVILIAVIGLAAGGVTVAYYVSKVNPTTTPTPTSTPTLTSTPTTSLTPTSTGPTPITVSTPTSTPSPTPNNQPKEPIRIGICADIDMPGGIMYVQGITLAVEQINAEGGLLGRNLTVVTADDDSSAAAADISVATNALTRLITVDKADYLFSGESAFTLTYQDICSVQKKILLLMGSQSIDYTQRVLDNYDRYKYFFRTEWMPNSTCVNVGYVNSLAALKSATGFTKIAYLTADSDTMRTETIPYLDRELPKLGFEIVYRGMFATSTIDYTSYFVAAEAAKAQILWTFFPSVSKSVTLVNEWYERQSPMVLTGSIFGTPDPTFWNTTSGKTEFVISKGSAVIVNYPGTNKTLPSKDAFLQRWGTPLKTASAAAYDTVRFILSDAIMRAGTTETEAVIKALETTKVVTALTRGFQFTSSHDIFIDEEGMSSLTESNMLFIEFQWQNGVQVPIYPEMLRIQAGATYKFPPWQGPWNK